MPAAIPFLLSIRSRRAASEASDLPGRLRAWSFPPPVQSDTPQSLPPRSPVLLSSVQCKSMNFSTGGSSTAIAVNNAQTVVANSTGNQLLVFSNDSDSVTRAVSRRGGRLPWIPVATQSRPTGVCTIVPGFDRPVFAHRERNTAYVLNCGAAMRRDPGQRRGLRSRHA